MEDWTTGEIVTFQKPLKVIDRNPRLVTRYLCQERVSVIRALLCCRVCERRAQGMLAALVCQGGGGHFKDPDATRRDALGTKPARKMFPVNRKENKSALPACRRRA